MQVGLMRVVCHAIREMEQQEITPSVIVVLVL